MAQWHSIRDLENAAKNLERRLEERSEEKGRRLAENCLNNTALGRGLWVFLLWPAWFIIFTFIGGICCAVLEHHMGISSSLKWAGLVGGIVVAHIWYNATFTRMHPFLSFLVGSFGPPFLLIFLTSRG